MKPGKFSGQHKKEIKGKALQEKLDIIAQALAEQVISGKPTLLGIADLEDGLAALKTLGAHFAMLNKIDGPEAEGNAFDEYKKRVASGGGRGDQPEPRGLTSAPTSGGNVIPLSFSELFPGTGKTEGPDEGSSEAE